MPFIRQFIARLALAALNRPMLGYPSLEDCLGPLPRLRPSSRGREPPLMIWFLVESFNLLGGMRFAPWDLHFSRLRRFVDQRELLWPLRGG